MGKIDSFDSKKGFKKGYVVDKVMSDNQLNKKFAKANRKNKDNKTFPNGLIPFGFLLLFYLIFLSVCIGLGATKEQGWFHDNWHASVVSCGAAYLLMNLLWAVGRTGFLSSAGYGMMKFGRFIRYHELLQKVKIENYDHAIKDVNSAEEYSEYVIERKAYTKRWFYISLITSASVFVISLIIWAIVEAC